MATDQPASSEEVVKLLQQIGLELAFVDPVQENGIAGLKTPIASLSAAVGGDAPEPVQGAIATARQWLDERAAADGKLTDEVIAKLKEWHPWLISAVDAWEQGTKLPASPAWLAPVKAGHASPAQTAAAAEVPDQLVEISIGDGDAEMLQLFCAEAQDLLQDIEQGVLVLESNPKDSTTIDTVFRAFHTFKGNVGVMKLVVLQQLTHELESLLDAARRGTFQLGRESIDVILAGEDILKRYVEEMSGQLSAGSRSTRVAFPIPRIIAEVHALLAQKTNAVAAPSPPPRPQPAAALSPPPVAAPAPAAVAPAPAPAQPRQAAPLNEVATPAPAAPHPQPEAGAVIRDAAKPAEAQQVDHKPRAAAAGIVRVDTLKLDGLIDLVGELVIAQSMVVQSPEVRDVASVHLSRCLGQLRGITSDLQRTAMSLRMVPIRNTFQKMARLVRDLGVQQGKDIQLILEGEDTELDRNIVEELGDPLVHMIRNSADHGIESQAERLAEGKPAAGTITLRAFHRGGFIVIEIQDDGRGLNPDRIRMKAVERGLVKPDDNIDERAIFDLIFAPGFSTAEKITDLSGRGVGMDVVRRNIERMRGKIEIESAIGRGTTFTISLPLTLAIIEGLLVGVGDQRYVIPTLSVRESFRPLPNMVTTVQGRGEMVSVRGRLTPVLRLGEHLNTPAAATDLSAGILVVVESGQDSRCLFVDELIGKQEVVIKSLGDMFHQQTNFAGAAILGDGRVGLILDVNALVKLKSRNGEAAA
jgi:two-component system chemotaxis sensor kinase CheA